ncbi:pre-rrna processing protein [Colletotrichum incanum]|uniref:Pre-rrna processing protein n=1 Tax=Colletotrichum incanum TaxID=1573173 RepID=A0A167C5S5_COLIC|nr:pre-rrna processing protein [Colletotrichum incanum]OHW98804.1 pre-rRNA-processing protein esf1 [Colletotrichum incanum]
MSSKSSKNGKIADSRFSNFETDPRFRLPSKKQTKTTIDKRFSRMLKDDSFTSTAKVDRYGRKVKSDTKKKALQRLYEPEDGEEEDGEEQEEGMEVEADDVVERELAKADAKYDPARGGGFSESESESDSEDDDESEEEAAAVADPKASMSRLHDEQAEVEDGEVTNRIAIVNLDWDNIKSADLFALFTSFLPSTGGRIEKVSIYPSEFGKERMQREELEGPPKEIFKKSDDSDEDSEDSEAEEEAIKKELLEEGDAEDFDHDALRKYQLDRLRYFYAVMTVSDKATAQKLYEATDGTEYQSSSNFLDLRFIPDDVTFDDEPRDECNKMPEGYKPVEFITDALQHSKVKLTWDVNPDDAARKASINRAFTGSRSQLEENDLKAYLASDSEDDGDSFAGFDDEDKEEEEATAADPKLSKKELARRKMREALGLGAEEEKKSKDGPVGEMEITFTPALTESKKDKKPEEEETTIEKYKRKERERKEKKREAARARREGGVAATGKEVAEPAEEEEVGDAGEDLGFDDPFFTTEEPAAATKTKTSIRKEERLAKRVAREAEEKEKAEQKAQLQLLMADENGNEQAEHLDHFDMNEILKAEKLKKKKGKAAKKLAAKKAAAGDGDEKVGLQQDFKMDVDDDRFKAVFESHEYAIDPSNPKFKGTEAMQKLLEEGRKKRKAGGDGDDEPPTERDGKKAKKSKGEKKAEDEELSRLVASVKKKASSKAGKR